jgi:hypothetical protein
MRSFLTTILWVTTVLPGALVCATPSVPSFEEVSNLVLSNLAGATPEEINRLAVEGFLKELSPRVVLVDEANTESRADAEVGVLDVQVYRDTVGYVRLGRVEAGTGPELRTCFSELTSTNRLSGLVLDLRLAQGDDYSAAADIADLFLSEEVPLMNWGEGLKRSVPKPDAITLPLAVLINGRTGGNAEALAAVLKQTGVALLIGNRTAGTAGIQQAFPLSEGGHLNITVSGIQLGDAQLIKPEGVKPDVEVRISANQESALLNPGRSEGSVASTQSMEAETNGAPERPRMNEADLVRHWRGERLTVEDAESASVAADRVSNDPALLRALDLMEGLAILRSWQR